ncbi:histidine phosphatase family protein [Plantibacter sp. YIM 135249]|uniref:histidine phosphatase family protein n=1 Tax=Plantibacter sp. YIM 135249 TaxID=3423918 RepID=UPI003D32AABB
MRLILIRHGQTPSNVAGFLDTAIPGADLSDLGREQAAAIPSALQGERIDAVYASTAARAQQTAAPLAAAIGHDVILRDGLREIHAGDNEMRNDMPAVEVYMHAIVTWARGDMEHRMPGGESGTEVFDRFDTVIEEIAMSGLETVVVVSHGAMLRTWVGLRSTNVDAAFVAAHPITNTGVLVVTGSPADGWTVESWSGDAGGGLDLTETAADGPAAEVTSRGF